MPDLFDDQLAALGGDPAIDAVAQSYHVPVGTARDGAVFAAPIVLACLSEWVEAPFGAAWMTARLPTVDPIEAGGRAGLETHRGDGDTMLTLALGDHRKEIAEAVGARANLETSAADELMSLAGAALMVALATRHHGQPSRGALVETLGDARDGLLDAGWHDWIAEATNDRYPTTDDVAADDDRPAYPPPVTRELRREPRPTGRQGRRHAPAGPDVDPRWDGGSADADPRWDDDAPDRRWAAGAAGHGAGRDYGPPVYGAARRGAAGPEAGLARNGGGTGTRRAAGAAVIDDVPPPSRAAVFGGADDSRSRPFRWETVALVGLGAVALAAIIFALMSRNSSDDTEAVAPDQTTVEADGADGAVATTQPDTTAGGDASGGAGAGAGYEPMALSAVMTDPLENTAGTGTANLQFDPDAGQVCYEMAVDGLAAPYDGHIHVGPAGVKGGIVVDFGPLTGDPSGCLDVNPNDVQAILADLPGHYVELHDAGGVATIRAQLSDDMSEAPMAAEAEEGGAYAVIEAGALRLVGDVPDQETIDKYLETFADVDLGETELINDLQIVPGSPRPSGRIVVDAAIVFEVDSDVLAYPDSTVIGDLATLFIARPAWLLTVVGHTDATGSDVYNLELSLRRAEAVRAALVGAGVSPDVLTVNGAGSTDPVASNETEEGRAMNRRIEFIITPA